MALLTVHMESMSSLLNPNLSLSNHISIYPHMAALDIASVIGTWVAAFVAILALVGIIGPVLIWRASRTERHLAISAIDDDDNTFRSRGIHAGPRIWLFQRMRAPILNIAPASFEQSIPLSLDAVKEPISSTNWVQFGILLQAYGVRYRTGDKIQIRNNKTHLPVHRLWLLFLGLKGRYGERKDLGRLRPGTRNISFPPPPERRRHDPRLHYLRYRSPSIEEGVPTDERMSVERLSGVTGDIKGRVMAGDQSITVIKFQLASLSVLGQLAPDVLPSKEIFLLSAGCIQLHSGGYYCFWESETADDAESSDTSDGHEEAFEVGEGDYDAHVHVTRPRQRPKPSRVRTYTRRERSYVGFAAYEIGLADGLDAAFLEHAKTFDADAETYKVLNRVHHNSSLVTKLKEYQGRTYVPADSPWVRLSSADPHEDEVFIARADAQEIAQSLLQITWHPESYLIASTRHAIDMRLLTSSASRFHRVAERICVGIDKIGLGNSEQTRLLGALRPAIRKAEKATVDRSSTASMYRLDQVLGELGQRDDKLIIDRMVGILTLTNEEFQELLYQSLRHLQETSHSVVQVDLRAATFKIPAAFGFMQTFILDLDRCIPIAAMIPTAFHIRPLCSRLSKPVSKLHAWPMF